MIRNWSFSRLMQYETCPFRVKLKVIDREPEPAPEPNSPLERGNREHKRYELYVQGQADALDDAEARNLPFHRPNFDKLVELHDAGMVRVEDNWKFDDSWNLLPADSRDYWLYAKADCVVLDEDNNLAIVIDYKTGKSAYKMLEHTQQLQFYSGLGALIYEFADKFVNENWYTDEATIRQFESTREDALRIVGRFEKRADRMLNDKVFRPNPNIHNCRYCPYSPRGTGVCPVGV